MNGSSIDMRGPVPGYEYRQDIPGGLVKKAVKGSQDGTEAVESGGYRATVDETGEIRVWKLIGHLDIPGLERQEAED